MKTVGYLALATAICVVIVWIFMALRPANAQPIRRIGTAAVQKVRYKNLLPPVQFDVPYQGELMIWIVQTKKDMEQFCPREKILQVQANWSGLACAPHTSNQCAIYIVKDDLLKAYGRYNHILALRHELGHCNGWGADHAGGRMVYADEPLKALELPSTTKWLKAYPPLVCLTPDGREESCADRSAKPNVADRSAKPNVKVAQAETSSPQQPTDPWAKSIEKREGYRFAPSGKLLMLDVLYGAKLDCTSYMPVEVKIAPPPKHGTIELPTEEFVMQGWADSNPRAKCNGKNATGTYIKYKSDDGYKGPDAFTVFAIWPNGTASEWHYTIDVR